MRTFSNTMAFLRAPLTTLALTLCTVPAIAQANETVALADMRNMAQAMEIVALDTTRYVSLENLNDSSATSPTNAFDTIRDQGGPYTIIPQDGFFLPRRNLTVGPNPWRGPYVNFQQGRTQTGTTPYDQGSPLDPWGTPYYLFNPFGLIRGDQGIITLELYGDQFDRYIIVSLGPDGIKSSDDLAFAFGAGVTSTRLTSLRGSGVSRTSPVQGPPAYDVQGGTTVTLRGFNFGSAGPNKRVMFGATALDNVVSWTSREITIVLPPTLSGADGFSVFLGGGSTNAIPAVIIGKKTEAKNWLYY